MNDVKWIKLSTNMFEDEKIRLIEQMPDADTILIIWVKLLAQAGRTNASGYIYLSENIPYTDEMLATIFNRPISTVRLALETFKQFGMIDIDESSFIRISNWEKHQNIEGMERIRLQNRERKRRQRERENKHLENKNVTSRDSHATEEEREEEREVDKDKDYTSKIKDLLPVFSPIKNFNELNKKYWDVIRETRKTGKISKSVIYNTMKKWEKYDLAVIEYALKSHIEMHAGKKEEYTIGIMRNTSAEEAAERLNEKVTVPLKAINGGKQHGTRQSSYEADYSKYDFSKMGNVSWLQEGN
ncbi:phage replisome organizer N-terminal domain-containing protein [Virgibacillus alimentarius]|uniref:phage replisome organizer N-terminal domain-containing protein n=1 Tax=Virgibacillus alimentarius TaxID=698769 RepID=UPI00068A9A7D|nr:phage replisome organizer N-terminal domain-containing protein [Virgibacillus alimentarius]